MNRFVQLPCTRHSGGRHNNTAYVGDAWLPFTWPLPLLYVSVRRCLSRLKRGICFLCDRVVALAGCMETRLEICPEAAAANIRTGIIAGDDMPRAGAMTILCSNPKTEHPLSRSRRAMATFDQQQSVRRQPLMPRADGQTPKS